MKNSCKHAVIALFVTFIILTAATGVGAQSGSATAKPAASSSSAVTEAMVDSFLKQMFGWNQELTWKIAEIKPSEAQGFSEVTAIFNTPQGQQVFRVFV